MSIREAFFTHTEIGEGTFALTAPLGEQMYLVCGSDRAVLIDTGMGVGSLFAYVSGLTQLPLTVINTHGHPDHAGGNSEFALCLMHPGDMEWFLSMCYKAYRREDIGKINPARKAEFINVLLPDAPVPKPLADEAEIDLGGRSLRVSLTPGHTPGSVCVYDEKSRSLFVGDTLSCQNVWLYDAYSEPLNTWYQSLGRIQKEYAGAKYCYTGHLPGRLGFSAVEAAQICARRILMLDAKGLPARTFAGEGLQYATGGCRIIYNPDNLF